MHLPGALRGLPGPGFRAADSLSEGCCCASSGVSLVFFAARAPLDGRRRWAVLYNG